MARTGETGPTDLFTLIIVDDEESVRVGLADLIDWSALGFRLLRTFADGDRAVEYLASHRVDIVLTDIVMARTSGLEVAAYVQAHCPTTGVIVLSGHDDFALARQAIETQVRHYILKPTDIDELRSVFRSVREDLVRRRDEELRGAGDDELVKQMTMGIRQHVLLELSRTPGGRGRSWLRKELSRAQLPLQVVELPVASATVDLTVDGRLLSSDDADRAAVFLGESTEGVYPVPLVWADRIEVLGLTVTIHEQSALRARLDSLVRERVETLCSLLGRRISVGASEVYPSVHEWAARTRDRHTGSRSHVHAAIARSLDVIESLLESGLTVERVADAVNLSVSYFSHLFHADMGMTFSRYLRDRRMERARKYLLETEYTVQEISERVGYSSAKHFYRVFHETTGMTPAAYRGTRRGGAP